MRWSPALVGSFLVACTTPHSECLDECLEAWDRRLQDIHKQGGVVERCAPDKVEVMVHFDGPPHVAPGCVSVSYDLTLPDCTTVASAISNETDAVICRAVRAFPDQVVLLGPNPRVDASHEAHDWRVRLATPEQTDRQRGILVILPDDASIEPRAILY
jgi:hypothetical protein